MCGICGKFNFDQTNKVHLSEIEKMADVIYNRGPDDYGYYLNNNIGLGFRRLSIIDVSTGHQPLSNENGTVWIVFNGEIYNYVILRQKLIQKGHQFKTNTDTEVIVHLYEEYNNDCVKHLRGMFAFVIWDNNRQKLFCARDRFGIKPFFYFIDSNRILFGSEIKNIFCDPEVSDEISIPMLDHYLAYGYSSKDATIYQYVKKLEPAHILEIYTGGKFKISKYWDIHYEPDYRKSEEDWCEIIEDKLSEVVNMHMMSDVPLGAFLSGGIDSSSVVALMTRFSDTPVKTFSIGFKEAEFNELNYAREIAYKYKTDHHEKIIEPESISLLPKLVNMYDEPFADESAIPTYFVSKFAREYVTVALSGDGGDELFAGYKEYKKFNNIVKYNFLPDAVSNYFWGGLHKTIPQAVKGKGISYYLSKPKSSLPAYLAIWHLTERERLLRSEYWASIQKYPAELKRSGFFDGKNSADFIFNMQKMDMQRYMVDDILTKVDRASMYNSLEVRVPLLDHEFAELTFSIPSELKIKRNVRKYIFKRSMSKYLTSNIISHKKQGFSLPLKIWFKSDLNDYLNDTLTNQRSPVYDYLEPAYVQKIIKNHQMGIRDFNRRIWSLIFLNQWLIMKGKKN